MRAISTRRLPLFLLLLVLVLDLNACGLFPGSRSKDEYTVNGRTYHLLHSAKGYRKVGVASYYADRLHGRKTASGERFNKNAMTCAHTILPFRTKLRVTNLQNKRTVIVRVNDRGPFKRNRLIDLSPAAAKKLGFIQKGSAKVLVEYVPD